MALKPISIFVPEQAHRALRHLAVERDTTMNRILLRAIDKEFPELQILQRETRKFPGSETRATAGGEK